MVGLVVKMTKYAILIWDKNDVTKVFIAKAQSPEEALTKYLQSGWMCIKYRPKKFSVLEAVELEGDE